MATPLRTALAAATVAAALLALPAGQASAINATCGMIVTGDLKLTNDLKNCPGDGLIAGTSGITINLNGHKVDGVTAAGSIGIDTNNHSDVTIKGGKKGKGTISQFDEGVEVTGPQGTVKKVKVSRASDAGVRVNTADDVRVIDSKILKTRAYGIELISARRAEVSGNLVRGPDTTNISNAAILVNNSDSHENVIDKNLIEGGVSTINGVLLNGSSDGTTVRRNEITGVTAVAIFVYDNATNSLVEQNEVHGNGSDGIRVESGAGTGTQLLENVAKGNGGDGIDAQKPGVEIGDNEAAKNDQWGIQGVAGVVDLGGNSAKGNSLGQCQNVTC